MSHANLDTTTADPSAPSDRRRTLAMVCLLVATFMELMDATVVNVALSELERTLGASPADLQWVVAGYPLAYAAGLIVGARLGDRFGRRRVFLIGLAAFGLFSLGCGLALDPTQLIIGRLLQGAAGALMVPQVLANIQVMYPPAERGRAMGMFTSVIGIAGIAGPITGGLLTNANLLGLGWRPIFLINVPVALLGVLAGRVLIEESRAERPASITVGSALLLGGSMAGVMVGVTMGPEHGWAWWTIAVAGLGVLLLVCFVGVQRRIERAGGTALVPSSLFTVQSFRRGVLAYALLSLPSGGFFLVHSIHVQHALGWSTLHTGLSYVPFSIATSVAAALAATKLVAAWGSRTLQVGAGVFAAGLLAMTAAEASVWPGLWLLLAMTVAGAGFGMIVGSSGLLILHDVPVELAGAASGVFNTVSALSVAFGAGAVGAVYANVAGSPDAAYRAAMWVMVGLLVAGLMLAAGLHRTARTSG